MNPAQPFSTPSIRLGVCPAHFKFADVLAPDENGKLPRHPDGQLKVLTELKQFLTNSPVPLSVIPMFTFSGTQKKDLRETLTGIQSLGITPEAILMINGADPMNPDDEDKFLARSMEILEIAKSLNINAVCSTTFEQWMDPAPTKTGADYDAAVAQLIKGHQPLRDAVPGHGVDTTKGRSYNQLIFDGLLHVDKHLNALVRASII